jgi:hypothetical protein
MCLMVVTRRRGDGENEGAEVAHSRATIGGTGIVRLFGGF